MKLLFVHQNLGEFGGAESYVELVARGLRERGHSVSLLYSEKTGRNEVLWEQTFEESIPVPEKTTAEWVQAILDRLQPDLIFLHNFSELDVIGVLIRSGIPAVRMMHDHSSYCLRSCKYNYFTRKICSRPLSGFCVFPCLGFIGRDKTRPLGVKWASLAQKRKELRLNRQCAALFTYSSYQRQELVRNGFEPTRIFLSSPMRVHGNETTSTFSDRNLVLFAGQLIRGKGVDALLRSLTEVRVHFECIILGQGSHRDYCERLCQRLGLAHRVRFHGYVLPAEVQRYYLDASVFVMSSLWPEPFGLAGPEAMRYGLPVVAFDAGGIKEWLHDGKNGFLAPWGDTHTFARRVEQLLADKQLARRLGEAGRSSVRCLDSNQQIERLETVLRSICLPAPAAEIRPLPLSSNPVFA